MSLLLLLVACESTATSGHPFSPAASQPQAAAAPAVDVRFEEPAALFKISSEELAAKEGGAGAAAAPVGELAPSDAAVAALAAAPSPAVGGAPAAYPSAPFAAGTSVSAQFPVRLLSTIPQAQPPRAVLGLPNGSEVVVSPGMVLADQGLVVMSVMAGRVQLAKVVAAGDHATIESLELSAQYP